MKEANTQSDILEVIKKRWSPRAFSEEKISWDTLHRIFEAMTWSASSYNEQPWRLIVGQKGEGDTYDKLLACLNPWNQQWAKSAPVLLLVVGKKDFSHNDSPNGAFAYDCGAAATTLALQATQEGLYLHQMAGILPEKAVETFEIPDNFQVLTAIALGKLGELDRIDEQYHASEKAPRSRKSVDEVVFKGKWKG